MEDRGPKINRKKTVYLRFNVQGLTLAMCPLARVHFVGCRASSGHNNSFSTGPRGQ